MISRSARSLLNASRTRFASTASPSLIDAITPNFFDDPKNFGVSELRPKQRPGRSWTSDELRLKSNEDLHKLWYVCLKERNMLLTMDKIHKARAQYMPNPERLDKVAETMNNIQEVPELDDDAYLMQKLWNEKELCKQRDRKDDEALAKLVPPEKLRFKRGAPRVINRVEDVKIYQ